MSSPYLDDDGEPRYGRRASPEELEAIRREQGIGAPAAGARPVGGADRDLIRQSLFTNHVGQKFDSLGLVAFDIDNSLIEIEIIYCNLDTVACERVKANSISAVS